MNLKQLKYVLVLSKEGNFSKAADALNITQPSLSQYIKKIEKELGTELFERTSQDVRLTDAGRVYVETGKRILDLEHCMNAKLLDISENKYGSLTIGTSPFRSASMMPTVAKLFKEQYPAMHLVIEEMDTYDLLENTQRGMFDFAITLSPVDEHLFSYEKICEEELVLAIPASYGELDCVQLPNRKYGAIQAEQISGMSFVMITQAQIMQKALNNLCLDCDINIRTAAVVKSLEAQIAMVKEGVGVALVPTGIERFCAADQVKFYSFVQELPKREVIAMWPKDRYLSNVAKELIDVIKKINTYDLDNI